jgi:hypothetical protein
LALLLASFGSNVLTEKEEEENKIGEAIDRILRFVDFVRKSVVRLFCQSREETIVIQNNNNEVC